jgi:hypothetical protein
MDLSNTGILHCVLDDNKETGNDVKQATTQYGDSALRLRSGQNDDVNSGVAEVEGDLVARTA